MPHIARTRYFLFALSLAAPAFFGAAGCENSKTTAYVQALEEENNELRALNARLEEDLQAAEAQYAQLAQEREQLIAENQTLRDQLGGGGGTNLGDGPTFNDPNIDVSMRSSDVVLSVAGDVLFSSGSVTLRNAAKSTLNNVAQVLQSQYPGNAVRIAGHTDSDPIRRSKWQTNERLSAERALAVEEYLASRGVSKDRMYIAGYADAAPRGSKAQSRRVEIIIIR